MRIYFKIHIVIARLDVEQAYLYCILIFMFLQLIWLSAD